MLSPDSHRDHCERCGDHPLRAGQTSSSPKLSQRPDAVFNERRTLRTIVRRVLDSPTQIPLELIAVDDVSSDGSAEILERTGRPRSPRPTRTTTRGTSVKVRPSRPPFATMAGDIAIIQDADLEYDPAEIPRVIRPILDGNARRVFGSRFLSSDYRRVLYFGIPWGMAP